MRLKNLIITFELSLAVFCSSLVGSKAFNKAEEVKAISPAMSQRIYLQPGVASDANAKFAIYTHGGEKDSEWSDFMQVVEDEPSLRYVDFDLLGRNYIIVGRFAPGAEVASFDGARGFWNQTEDIDLYDLSYENCIKITGWDNGFMTYKADSIDADFNWYILGSGSFITGDSWSRNPENKLKVSEPGADYKQYTITLDLQEGDVFKFRKQDQWIGYGDREVNEANQIGKGIGAENPSSDDSNFTVSTSGNYSFFLKVYNNNSVKVWANKNEAPATPAKVVLHKLDNTTQEIDTTVGGSVDIPVTLGGWSTTPAPYLNPVNLETGYTVTSEEVDLYEVEFSRDSANAIYFGFNDWDLYVYSFGKNACGQSVKPYGDWPGTKVQDLATGVSLNGYGLAKVSVNPQIETKVVFSNNGDAAKTVDLTVTVGNYYSMIDNVPETTYTGSEVLGQAAAWVFDFNTSRLTDAKGSICSLVSNTSLKERYASLSDEAKTLVGDATIWTWESVVDGNEANIKISDMISVLGYSVAVLPTFGLNSIANDSSFIVVIIVVTSLVISSVGLYFLKRKKHA